MQAANCSWNLHEGGALFFWISLKTVKNKNLNEYPSDRRPQHHIVRIATRYRILWIVWTIWNQPIFIHSTDSPALSHSPPEFMTNFASRPCIMDLVLVCESDFTGSLAFSVLLAFARSWRPRPGYHKFFFAPHVLIFAWIPFSWAMHLTHIIICEIYMQIYRTYRIYRLSYVCLCTPVLIYDAAINIGKYGGACSNDTSVDRR